jgi:SAM-dependent methyltransferase
MWAGAGRGPPSGVSVTRKHAHVGDGGVTNVKRASEASEPEASEPEAPAPTARAAPDATAGPAAPDAAAAPAASTQAAPAPASVYDPIARLYDPWSRSVTEDVAFYVEEARRAGGPVVELGVGTGRIAVPTATAGVSVIGVDDSQEMLAVCRERAAAAGVARLLDLRLGDLSRPPVGERVRLVTCPFRAYLHLRDERERLRALRAAHALLVPGGRLVFDVFAPAPDDIAETHARWLEREPGIWERADWNTEEQTLTLRVRGPSGETVMRLTWTSPEEWKRLLRQADFKVEACFGWFDRQPYEGGEDTVWVARRRR